MKAILVNDDRSLRWDDMPNPVVGPEDCLVKIEYAAINRADLMQREGDYPPPPGCPEWMGLEISGQIVEIGEEAKAKSNWKLGDKVCALLGGGGYAQYANIKYDMLMPVPKNCTMAEAAAMPEAFATAYLNLFYEGRIQPGNTLLMNAGASGLASVVIPMAKAFGARVITTVLSDEIAASITHLKADRVVVTTKEDISMVLKEELEKGHGVDVAIDCLGGEIMGKCIADSIQYIQDIQLLDRALWKRFVDQFREDADFDAGWRGEYWGKMMRGACFVYTYNKDPALYAVLRETVADMMTTMDQDGRISSYYVNHEFDGWDIWCRKYVLLGMQYFLEICTEDALCAQIIESMGRQVDYLIRKIGPADQGKLPITLATRHWRGLNSCSLLEPIVRLYTVTGEKRYFDFAEYIVGCGGTDVVNIFELAYADELYPYQYPVTKAYEMTSCFEGLLEFYRLTGIEKYKVALVNYANKILESDFTVIGSCGCTHELFDHSTVRQANTTNEKIMQETCVTVTLMKFFSQLALLTGDAKYSDAFEISAYNAFLGSINTEKVVERIIQEKHPDWAMEPMPFDSYSPLTAGTRGNGIGGLKQMSDNHYYGCCACIGSAGCGLIPKMALLTTEEGFAYNLFISGSIDSRTPGGQAVSFETVTDYPVSGRVTLKLHLDKAESFELLVRIPGWSKDTKLWINGASVAVHAGYTSIRREWADGDTVTLELDMRTQAIYPEIYGHQVLMNKVIWGHNYVIPTFDRQDPLAPYHLALRRGPITLAQENRLGYSVDTPVDIAVDENGYVKAEIPANPIAPYKNMVELSVPLTDGTMMHVTDYASAGKLWTEESKMAAWMRTVTKHTT